jgi:RNA polymerase sigma-70 factor (ECF subfamily)
VKPSPGELWKSFSDRLRRYIAKRVRNEHDSDDLLQEVFAKIQAGLDRVESEEKLEAWLFQITRRTIADHFRMRRSPGLPAEIAEEIPESDVSSEVASWLTPMMESLDEDDRETLRLTDLEGLPQKELAARLGLSLTGAKSRVQRARKRLKEILLDCCQIETDRRGNALSYTPKNCSSCSCD